MEKQIQQTQGTSIKGITTNDIKNINCTLPNIKEQEKIATFLTTVDKKITNLENTITSLENQKKGLLQQIFSQKLRFKDKNGNNYPEWEKNKLKNLCTYKTSSLTTKDIDINGNYQLFDANNAIGTVSSYISNKPYISIIKDGAGVGRIRLLKPYTNCVSTLGILLNTDTTTIQYIYYLLQQVNFSIYIVGSTIPHIYYKDYSSIILNIPCLEEQTKIADFLSAFDRKLDNQKAQLEYWKQIKKGLLQQMFV